MLYLLFLSQLLDALEEAPLWLDFPRASCARLRIAEAGQSTDLIDLLFIRILVPRETPNKDFVKECASNDDGGLLKKEPFRNPSSG